MDVDNIPQQHKRYCARDMLLFEQAVKDCKIFADKDIQDLTSELAGGSEDPILALMMTQILNVKKIMIGSTAQYLINTCQAVKSATQIPLTTWLSKLDRLVIGHEDADNEELFDLITAFEALPSMTSLEFKDVEIGYERDEDPGFHKIPLSQNIESLSFRNCSISGTMLYESIEAFSNPSSSHPCKPFCLSFATKPGALSQSARSVFRMLI